MVTLQGCYKTLSLLLGSRLWGIAPSGRWSFLVYVTATDSYEHISTLKHTRLRHGDLPGEGALRREIFGVSTQSRGAAFWRLKKGLLELSLPGVPGTF